MACPKSVGFLLVAIMASVAMATDKVTVSSRGVAKTYDEAVQSALKDAVRQVNGSAFAGDTKKTLQSAEVGEGQVTADQEHLTDDFHEVLKGVVLGHRVKKEINREDGLIEVRLEVDVAKYTAPMKDSREKVAVMMIKPMIAGFQIGGEGKECYRPAPLVVEELSSRITTAIVQSGRFGVLSREDEDAIRAEEKIIADNAPVEEMVKIGQRLGADYLVTGTLRNIHVGAPVTTTSQLTGQSRSMLSFATLRMTYRVIVVSTAQIAWTENVDLEFDPNTLAQCYGRPGAAYASLLETAARQVGTAFANNLYRNPPQQAAQSAPAQATADPVASANASVNVTIIQQQTQHPPVQGGVKLPFDK